MKIIKKVRLEKCFDKFNILYTNNGHQWNTVYYDDSLEDAKIILEAYKKIGYKEAKDVF